MEKEEEADTFRFVGTILEILRYFPSLEQLSIIYLDTLRKVFLMLKANIGFVIPATLTLLIIIFGAIGVYLAEHEHQGADNFMAVF